MIVIFLPSFTDLTCEFKLRGWTRCFKRLRFQLLLLPVSVGGYMEVLVHIPSKAATSTSSP